MSLHNALQHDGGPYPTDMLAALRTLAVRDGLPGNADLVSLAQTARGIRPGRFTRNGVRINGTTYFVGRWALAGSDEDGGYATDVTFLS
jgi:hypothetical protein